MIEVRRSLRVFVEIDVVKRLALEHLFTQGVCVPADAAMFFEGKDLVFSWFENERIETADGQ